MATNITTATLIAGDTLSLYANAFDHENNYIGPVNVDWSFLGTNIGEFSATTNSSSTVLTTDTAGVALIQAISGFRKLYRFNREYSG